jgi:hypothetical protein
MCRVSELSRFLAGGGRMSGGGLLSGGLSGRTDTVGR